MSDAWTVVPSPEVAAWYGSLSPSGKAEVDEAVGKLKAAGHLTRMPLSRTLDGGPNELRFSCEGKARRISYTFDEPRRINTLVALWHQKRSERKEATRARAVLKHQVGVHVHR